MNWDAIKVLMDRKFLVAFLKDLSKSFIVREDSRVVQIMSAEQVSVMIMSLGAHVLSSQHQSAK